MPVAIRPLRGPHAYSDEFTADVSLNQEHYFMVFPIMRLQPWTGCLWGPIFSVMTYLAFWPRTEKKRGRRPCCQDTHLTHTWHKHLLQDHKVSSGGVILGSHVSKMSRHHHSPTWKSDLMCVTECNKVSAERLIWKNETYKCIASVLGRNVQFWHFFFSGNSVAYFRS